MYLCPKNIVLKIGVAFDTLLRGWMHCIYTETKHQGIENVRPWNTSNFKVRSSKLRTYMYVYIIDFQYYFLLGFSFLVFLLSSMFQLLGNRSNLFHDLNASKLEIVI